MPFEFATATRILFGAGVAGGAGTAIAAFGARALLVTGGQAGRAEPVQSAMAGAGLDILVQSVTSEPTVEWLRDAASVARAGKRNVVVAVGGGSVIDAGKGLAAMLANPGDPLDYLEVIGRGQPLRRASVPFVAIPTTAGTGAEVTRNAVLGSAEHGVKASLRSAGMLPRLAVVDPELTLSLPPALTAHTGLDALTQLIEPYVCARANPITDVLCREAIPLVARSLRMVFSDGTNLEARTDMALASLFGGLALANSGLGAVHGFAAPIGGRFSAPHGAVCAALLPHAMRVNIQALRDRGADGAGLRRYRDVAAMLTGKNSSSEDDGVFWVEQLCQDLAVPPLASWGLSEKDAPALVSQAAKASSMKANPIVLTESEMRQIVTAAI